MARAVVAILAIVVVGFIAVFAFQAAVDSAGDATEITGESWSPTAGSVTTLDHSNLANTDYSDTVTVEDGSGNLVDRGADYEWFAENGTVKAVTGGALDGASSATIDYSYERTTEQQRQLARIAAIMPEVLGALVLLLGVVVMLVIMRG